MFLFTGDSLENARVGFVIDYQNMHLTAHNLFTPNLSKQKSLLHPLLLSQSVLLHRAHFLHQNLVQLNITQVRVFRGLPSNKQEPQRYAQNLSQKSEWSKDKRVSVEYLELKYRTKQGLPPQEKGIDVLTALNFVEMAQSGDFDLVILMTHDTDLQPALKMANLVSGVQIESAGWSGLNKLRINQKNLFHTFLTDVDFENSLDQKDYSKKGRKV
ncbi:MAG: hypothetical protein HW379_1273 [Actinobacteria bacterium]|nr:hypothetical protein [Actinomycetota bacterium]